MEKSNKTKRELWLVRIETVKGIGKFKPKVVIEAKEPFGLVKAKDTELNTTLMEIVTELIETKNSMKVLAGRLDKIERLASVGYYRKEA